MSVLDRALGILGLQRRPPAPVATRNIFTGAGHTRLLSDWVRQPLSADREIESDLVRLKGRARDLARNNAYAKRYVRMCRAHVVGPRGVQLRLCNEFQSGRPYDAVNEAIEEAFEDWSKPRHASANGKLSWLGLQRLAVSEWATSGEALCLLRYDNAYKYGVSLQPIDADRLDVTWNRARNPRTGEAEIRMGVELDEAGAPLAYHILDVHPADIGSTAARAQYRRRYPASQVIHLYKNDERVEQTRGVPELAVAMRDLRHLDGFQEAALVQARTSAAAMGFIVTKSPDGDTTEPDEGLEFSAEAGVIRELGVGQEFQSWDPNQPSDTYAGFVKAVLRGIAAGLGASYAMMANDLSDANYSSMRVGRAEEQETWQELQTWFIDQFCERVFEAWYPSAVLSGALVLPLSERRTFDDHDWIPRRWASVDPVKDVEADERRIALGVTSRQRISARDGDDLWEVMEDLAEEQDEATRLKITITPTKAAGGMPNGQADQSADAGSGDDAGAGSGGASDASGGGRANPHFALVRTAG